MYRILFILLFLSAQSVVIGQNYRNTFMLYGHLADMITRAPIDSAWVVRVDTAYHAIDSVQSIRKHMNGRDGGFMFNGRYPKNSVHILRISHPDYHTLTIPVKLKNDDPLPVIYLKRAPQKVAWETDMKEVTVTATKLKFFYKGDTLVYDASAFKLPEGSMLDDLIRQLPGAELRENGEILVNGRKIDQLLLQGRHMFNDNRQLILANLPYFTVKNLKVFETEGSKTDPLNRLYVMDVNLKKEYINSIIANAEAGLGTDLRYMARAFALGMSERAMVNAYVNTNNLNDIAKPGERGNWNPQSAGDGIPINTLAGIRYEADSKDENIHADGTVDFSHTSKDIETTTLRENYLAGGNTFENSFHTAHNRDISFHTSHSFSARRMSGLFDHINLNPSFSYNKFDHHSRYASALFNENVTSALGKEWVDSIISPQAGSILFSKSINRLMTENLRTGHSLNTDIAFSPSFTILGKPRISTFFNYSYSNAASKDFEHYDLDFPSQKDLVPVHRNNYMDRGNKSHSLSGQVRKSIYKVIKKYSLEVMPRYQYATTWGKSHDNRYLLHQLTDWEEAPTLGMLPSMAELLSVQDKANSSWQHIHITDYQ